MNQKQRLAIIGGIVTLPGGTKPFRATVYTDTPRAQVDAILKNVTLRIIQIDILAPHGKRDEFKKLCLQSTPIPADLAPRTCRSVQTLVEGPIRD